MPLVWDGSEGMSLLGEGSMAAALLASEGGLEGAGPAQGGGGRQELS